MTSILTGLQTMESAGELDELEAEMLSMSIQGGETLLGMINDLLDINKMESGSLDLQYGPVVVSELAQRCLSQVAALAGEKGLDLASSCPTPCHLCRRTARSCDGRS